MLWGSGALPASGTKALEEVGDLPKAHTFTHQPRSPPGMPRSAVVTCRAAPCCQAGTALLATPKLPGGRLRVRGASSHTGQSQGSIGMEGGHPGHGTAAPCQDTGEFAARISLRLCAQQIPGQHVKGRGYGPTAKWHHLGTPRRCHTAQNSGRLGWSSPRCSRPCGLDPALPLPSCFLPGLHSA